MKSLNETLALELNESVKCRLNTVLTEDEAVACYFILSECFEDIIAAADKSYGNDDTVRDCKSALTKVCNDLAQYYEKNIE